MLPHRLEVRIDPDGHPAVFVTCDLAPAQVSASVQALRTAREVRFRTVELSADDVLAMREMTSLADELGLLEGAPGIVAVELTVARLGTLRGALATLAAAEHPEREGDAAARPATYRLLDALDEIHAEAIRAAIRGTPTSA